MQDEKEVIKNYLRNLASKGGKSRWANMTPEQRKAAVRNMQSKRWPNTKPAIDN